MIQVHTHDRSRGPNVPAHTQKMGSRIHRLKLLEDAHTGVPVTRIDTPFTSAEREVGYIDPEHARAAEEFQYWWETIHFD